MKGNTDKKAFKKQSGIYFVVKESLIRKLEDTTVSKDGSNAKTLEFDIVMQK